MRLKPLVTLAITSAILAACSAIPEKKNTASNEPIVFTEPSPSPAFYALNPFNYNAPPAFEVELKKAAAQPVTKMIATSDSYPGKSATFDVNKLIIPTVNSKTSAIKYAPLASSNEVDITTIDDFLQLVEGKARHYPPHFSDKNERRGYESKLREVTQQLDTLAAPNNASYDVLIRAFKATVMARNLDLGQQYTTKSLQYAQRLIKMNPNDPETNFWFGFSLSEGGGQREAIPYLDKAIKAGVQEAYLSATNNYLFLEQKRNALTTLNNYKVKFPQEAKVVDRLVQEIQKQGRTNVWENLEAMKQGKY
ncbi:ABUW_2363 family tetratricopeptide repeat lipoprotein [Acinetobacter sp. MD2(2019)]|uniref:ABUW_2363 family tetratricopeptide repeat lipoprotein n=1 Tax=Acinetobacter sp. MD2(2019) TaxID=2605273 RepID=UPI002D1EBC07|nr:hypothetical protein [Acinetobacter sp. MD2(2019)]MEB3752867.1 hypothetical protein [Acinetobacter sp. MD2(2019)]